MTNWPNRTQLEDDACDSLGNAYDPNADLIGFQWNDGNGHWRVKETCSWSEQYVVVVGSNHHGSVETIKPAGAVRRRKELDATA